MSYTVKKTVTKIFTFDSAHHLPKYYGKCAELHGHTYKLEVTVSGEPTVLYKKKDSYDGIICDFGDLKDIVNEHVIERLDHQNLNTVMTDNPTAENIASLIFEILWLIFPGKLQKIKLWETPDSFAEVTLNSCISGTGSGGAKCS